MPTGLRPRWIQDVLAVPLAEVAEAVGLEHVPGGSWASCPACGRDRRGSSDSRGPVGFRPDELGWRCHRCGAGGDGLTLIALHVLGEAKPRGKDAWRQIRAWCAGRQWVRGTDQPGAGVCRVRSPRPVRRLTAPKRLPLAGVAWLWDRCAKVLDDTPVCRWLFCRAINPIPVEDLDLARALLPDRPALPRWARFRGRSWRKTGHRLVLPLFDSDGALRSLQARSVEPDPKPGEKAANPTGAQVAGLVFADGLAQQLLRGEQTEPTDVVIVEGVPDYLTWAARWGTDGALEDAPAVFGVVAGSWRGAQGQALGRRIPRGSRVVIRTHHDPAGDRYAEEIRRTSTLSREGEIPC